MVAGQRGPDGRAGNPGRLSAGPRDFAPHPTLPCHPDPATDPLTLLVSGVDPSQDRGDTIVELRPTRSGHNRTVRAIVAYRVATGSPRPAAARRRAALSVCSHG